VDEDDDTREPTVLRINRWMGRAVLAGAAVGAAVSLFEIVSWHFRSGIALLVLTAIWAAVGVHALPPRRGDR
jgi:hypothetical protein